MFAFFVLSQNVSGQVKIWTLDDCIQSGFENNVSLNQQKLVTETMLINYHQSKLNRIPSLNFTVAQQLDFGNTINTTTYQITKSNANSNYPSISANTTLYNGNRLNNLIKENKINYDASIMDIATQKNNLALSITAAYVQVLFNIEAVKVSQEQVESDSVEVAHTALYVAVGQTPEDSLLLLQAQLATDRAAKTISETQVDLTYVQLEQLMEKPISPDFAIEQSDFGNIEMDKYKSAGEVYSIALENLPDVHSAALKTKAYETDLLVSRAALLPSLTLSAGLSSEYYSGLNKYHTVNELQTIGYLQNIQSQPVETMIPVNQTLPYPFFNQLTDNFSQAIALTLSVPIFNSYKAHNNIKLSAIAVENARLNEQSVKNTLRKNVETAVTNLLADSKNYVAASEQLIARERAYADMKRKYASGLVNVTDFLVEQSNYFKAVMAKLQAKYEYIFQLRIVDFYAGKSLIKQ